MGVQKGWIDMTEVIPSITSLEKLVHDLVWELNVYHLSVGDCPRKYGMYCRICYIIEKATNYEFEPLKAHSADEYPPKI